MNEQATLYLPFPYPGAAFVEHIAAGASVREMNAETTLIEKDDAVIRWNVMPVDHVPEHLSGLLGYITQKGGGEAARIRAMSSVSVVGLVVSPGLQDPRVWPIIMRALSASDGLLFMPSGQLCTRSGEGLLGAGLAMPTPERVARRALILLSLSIRGLHDQDAGTPDEARAESDRQTWIQRLEGFGMLEEAEPQELALLKTPIGQAPSQDIINAVWRAEGAQVLLWALGARPLPALDVQEHPYAVAKECGLSSDVAPPLLTATRLRSAAEIARMQAQLRAINWRFVEHRYNGSRAFDFREFSRNQTLGAFSLDGIALSGDDLAVGGLALHLADANVVTVAASTASERHLAANWLLGVNPVYSAVQTPT